MTIYLGTQGWSYRDWVGSFYPARTQPAQYLAHYAQHFPAVELDTTFYGTPRPGQIERWREETPADFLFTAKLPRAITHDRHLVDAGTEFSDFVQVMAGLGEKLGALLIQLPPDLSVAEEPAVADFLGALPRSIRFAIEFRHPSWLREETFELLQRHEVASTIIDLASMPIHTRTTTDFAYYRWLGNRRQIQRMDATQLDRRARLDRWAEEIEAVAHRVERVYGFANNHYSGHSPADIRHLSRRLGLPERSPAPAPRQGSLL